MTKRVFIFTLAVLFIFTGAYDKTSGGHENTQMADIMGFICLARHDGNTVHLSWESMPMADSYRVHSPSGQPAEVSKGTTVFMDDFTCDPYRNDFTVEVIKDDEVIAVSLTHPVYDRTLNTLRYRVGSTEVTSCGCTAPEMKTQVQLIHGQSFVPVYSLSALDCIDVKVNAVSRYAEIEMSGMQIKCWADNPIAKVNGADAYLDASNHAVTPVWRGDSLLMPVRFLATHLGAQILWFALDREITLVWQNDNNPSLILLTANHVDSDSHMVVALDNVGNTFSTVPTETLQPDDKFTLPFRLTDGKIGKDGVTEIESKGLVKCQDDLNKCNYFMDKSQPESISIDYWDRRKREKTDKELSYDPCLEGICSTCEGSYIKLYFNSEDNEIAFWEYDVFKYDAVNSEFKNPFFDTFINLQGYVIPYDNSIYVDYACFRLRAESLPNYYFWLEDDRFDFNEMEEYCYYSMDCHYTWLNRMIIGEIGRCGCDDESVWE